MRLQFSFRSNVDLDRIYGFLTETTQSLKTADKALMSIKVGVLSLLDNPDIGTDMNDQTGRRELFVVFGKNNYVIRYQVDEEAGVIRILRIWHSREDRN